MQLHEDFSPILQVLYHVLEFQSSEFDADHCSTEQYINHMDELDYMVEDLCSMLLEYYGKHIAQPRRDLCEKATGLPVNPGKSTAGFLTEHEAETTMEVAWQQDLVQQHVSVLEPCR